MHRRQFVLHREPHKIHDDWVVVPLANGFALSYCPELEVTRALDADGRQWIVLGNSFDLDNEYRRAELSISRLPSQNIPCSTYSWAGRWALIGPSVIIPDASGCLGLFHYRSTTGRWLVSSSLSILTQLIRESGLDPAIRVTPRVLSVGMNWVPPPCTNAAPIRKLLPDQMLSSRDGQTIHLARLNPQAYAPLSTLKRARLLSDYLIGFLTSLAAEQRPIVIALTAGLDSRCALACALRAGLKFETVAVDHAFITNAD